MDEPSDEPLAYEGTGQQKEAMEHAKHIKLKEWNPTKHIPPHAYTILIYAQRGMGKSHLVKHFLYEQRKMFDEIFLMSGTADLGQDAYSFIPKENRIRDLDTSFIETLVNEQRELIKRENRGEKVRIKRICLYLDDCISEKSFVNSTAVKNLFILGRHCRIHVICLAQSIGGKDSLPLVIRDNSDIVIVFKLYNQYVRELVSEQFLSLYNKKIGESLLKIATETKYQAIVICRYMNDAKQYGDYCFTILAPSKLKEYTIGSTRRKEIVDYKQEQITGMCVPKVIIPLEYEDNKSMVDKIVY